MKIRVNFKNYPGLDCTIQNTPVGQKYFSLVRENYQQSFPVYRDELKYTPEYFRELALQAAVVFGWNWHQYASAQNGIGAVLHKDLEKLLAQGFENIPEQYDNLIHELHYALHLNQHGDFHNARTSWFQIEWYNDSGFELDPDFEFQPCLHRGDIKLQNPFVGHGPLQMWMEQDFINIEQTCKFHTFVKPGINIAHTYKHSIDDFDKLIEKFQQHAPNFVAQHGVDKIRRYTGYPVVGHVDDIDLLNQLKNSPVLELQSLEFYE